MKNSGISIIIPVYNRAELIKETLDSVLWQTNQNWECIVVDDGSTDNTWEVLLAYADKDKRIKVFQRNRTPKGAPTCRNIGMDLARGEYFMFLDSDDLLAPWCLEKRYRCITDDFDMLLFNGIEFNNKDLSLRKERTIFSKQIPNLKTYMLSYKVPFCTPSVLWNKLFFINSGLRWHEESMSSQDSVLHLLAIYKGARYKFASSFPDFFIRVENNFSKISNENSCSKIISRVKTLDYVENNLSKKDFKVYSYFFIIDLINRIEKIDSKNIKRLIPLLKDFKEKYQLNFLKTYLKLYYLSKNKPILRGIIYRLRNILLKHKRIENIREFCYIDELVFKELLELGGNNTQLANKVAIFHQENNKNV